MAKAESGLRTRIKQALEADGWFVITQHGSAYSPNVLDLTVVLACLEVKTDFGSLRPGQRNTIRKLRKQGIPAGIVRSVDEARLGMQRIKQGAYTVSMDEQPIDMSFLTNLLAGSAVAEPEQPSVAQLEHMEEAANGADAPTTLTELMGMQGTYEEFTPAPAPPDPEPEPAPATIQFTLNEGTPVTPSDLGLKAPVFTDTPVPSGGLLERIVGYLEHIDQMLTGIVEGYQGAVPAQEKPVRQTRRGRPPKTEETPEE